MLVFNAIPLTNEILTFLYTYHMMKPISNMRRTGRVKLFLHAKINALYINLFFVAEFSPLNM